MAKILLGLSIVLTLLTAGLGFMTKNKVEALQGDVKSSKQNLASATASLNSTKATLTKTTDDLTAAKTLVEERDSQIAKQKTDVDAANAKALEATRMAEERGAELASMKVKIEEMTGKPGVNVEEMATRQTELTAALQKAQTELAEARQVQDTLNARVKEAEDKASASQQQVNAYKGPIIQAGLTGRVLAFNPGWNFVVLSIGDRQGVKANTQMLVLRGNQAIAKVRITSVEPSQSIADVIPGTMARGTSVQAGDTVIYEAKR